MNRHREQGRDLQQYAIRLFWPDDFARVCVLEEGENGAPYPQPYSSARHPSSTPLHSLFPNPVRPFQDILSAQSPRMPPPMLGSCA